MNANRVLQLLDDIRSEILGGINTPPTPPPVLTDPAAPFGRLRNGEPRFAPAYDACRPLWEAANLQGWAGPNGHPFTIFDYVPGIQYLGGPGRTAPFQGNLLKLEDDVVWLGIQSADGRLWLDTDSNAALIDRVYCRRFVGYHVERINPQDAAAGYRRVTP